MVRRRILVSGRVQNVFFRDTCARVAADAGVAGWAENLSDGRVEVVLEGDADSVARVEAWCEIGPPAGRVDRVEGHDESPSGVAGFAIR
jgi:acylphosphatase